MGDVDLFGDPVADPIDPVPGDPHNINAVDWQQKRRRRSDVVADRIAAGRHPLTNGPLHPEACRDRTADSPPGPFTCGTCVHRQLIGHHTRSYPKCMVPTPGTDPEPPAETRPVPGESFQQAVARIGRRDDWFARRYPRVSRSDATDVRAWWPACPAYDPKPTEETTDGR